MTLKRTLVASALALLLAQSALAADAGTQGAVTVSDTDLTTLFRDNGVNIATVPEPNVEAQTKQELGGRLLASEAKKAGIDKSPEVQRAMQRAAEGELIKRYLLSQSTPPADFPSDQELQTAYNNNKAKLVQPKAVRIADIYLVGVDSATQARAKALDAELQKNPDGYADAAARNGGDRDNATRGGDWIAMRNLNTEFSTAIDATKVGGISKVIADKTGFHIVKVFDRREELTPTLEQVRPDLVRALREAKQRDLANAFVAKLVAQYPASVNTATLSRISAPGTTPSGSIAPAPAAAAPTPAPPIGK